MYRQTAIVQCTINQPLLYTLYKISHCHIILRLYSSYRVIHSVQNQPLPYTVYKTSHYHTQFTKPAIAIIQCTTNYDITTQCQYNPVQPIYSHTQYTKPAIAILYSVSYIVIHSVQNQPLSYTVYHQPAITIQCQCNPYIVIHNLQNQPLPYIQCTTNYAITIQCQYNPSRIVIHNLYKTSHCYTQCIVYHQPAIIIQCQCNLYIVIHKLQNQTLYSVPPTTHYHTVSVQPTYSAQNQPSPYTVYKTSLRPYMVYKTSHCHTQRTKPAIAISYSVPSTSHHNTVSPTHP